MKKKQVRVIWRYTNNANRVLLRMANLLIFCHNGGI